MPPSTSSLTNSPTPIPSLSPGARPGGTLPRSPRLGPMADVDVDVVVLGGGPAGPAAAWRAARAGRSVLLLERAPAVGGMAASFEVAGVRVDTGSHRLHPATPPPVLALLRELLGDDLQTRPRNGRLRVYDRWVGFPLRPAELARTLPPTAVLRIGRDAATRPLAGRDPTLVRVAAGQHARPELYNALTGRTRRSSGGCRPGHRRRAGPPPGQRRRRLGHRPHAGPPGPVRAAAGVLLPAPRLRPDRRRARRGGGRGGGAVETGAEVTAVEPGPDGVEVSTADGRTVRAGHVFSTVPLPVLARLAGAPVRRPVGVPGDGAGLPGAHRRPVDRPRRALPAGPQTR